MWEGGEAGESEIPIFPGYLRTSSDPELREKVAEVEKRVVQFFMSGAASQCDTFDYKPQLAARHGDDWDANAKVELFQDHISLAIH